MSSSCLPALSLASLAGAVRRVKQAQQERQGAELRLTKLAFAFLRGKLKLARARRKQHKHGDDEEWNIRVTKEQLPLAQRMLKEHPELFKSLYRGGRSLGEGIGSGEEGVPTELFPPANFSPGGLLRNSLEAARSLTKRPKKLKLPEVIKPAAAKHGDDEYRKPTRKELAEQQAEIEARIKARRDAQAAGKELLPPPREVPLKNRGALPAYPSFARDLRQVGERLGHTTATGNYEVPFAPGGIVGNVLAGLRDYLPPVRGPLAPKGPPPAKKPAKPFDPKKEGFGQGVDAFSPKIAANSLEQDPDVQRGLSQWFPSTSFGQEPSWQMLGSPGKEAVLEALLGGMTGAAAGSGIEHIWRGKVGPWGAALGGAGGAGLGALLGYVGRNSMNESILARLRQAGPQVSQADLLRQELRRAGVSFREDRDTETKQRHPKQANAYPGLSGHAVYGYTPVGARRDFDPAEKQEVEEGLSSWWPQIFQSYGTPAHRLLASPGKQALLYGLLGAVPGALGGAALGGAMTNSPPASPGAAPLVGAGVGALGTGGLTALLGYLMRDQSNEGWLELMRRTPQHSPTKRDLLSDPVYQAEEDRNTMLAANMLHHLHGRQPLPFSG